MSPKLYIVVAIALIGGALAFVSFGNLGENLVYYWSPTELEANRDKAVGATIRLGGLVEAGSVKNDGATLSFVVTDGTRSVPVHTSEIPPAMFREGIGVVVEGTVDGSGQFTSRRLMVKHDNAYKAPEAGQMPDKQAMFDVVEETP